MQAENSTIALLPKRKRGGYANKFRSVEIVSNHFSTTLRNINLVVIFSMAIKPKLEAKNRDKLQEIVGQIRDRVATEIPNPVFRGYNVFSKKGFENEERIITLEVPGHIVTIKQRKIFKVAEEPKTLQLFLNNSLRSMMSKLKYCEIGRTGKFFNSDRAQAIDNLKMFRGFASTFVNCEKGVYLRVDTARKIIRKDSVMDQIHRIYARKDIDKGAKRDEVKSKLQGNIVMTNYGKPTFYRVLEVIFNPEKMTEDMTIGEGDQAEQMNLKQYYQRKYNIEIKDLNQPLLEVQNKIRRREVTGSGQKKTPTLLVPELCSLTGIPDNFDEQRRKEISSKTILHPNEKSKEIQSFIDILNKTEEIKTLNEIGININKNLNKLQCKHIGSPLLELGNGHHVEKGKEARFNLFNQPLFSGKHDINVHILHTKNADVKSMRDTFEKTSANLKVRCKVTLQECVFYKDRDVLTAMEKAFKSNQEMNIMMVVIPGNLKTSYPKFKQHTLSYNSNPEMITQFLLEGTLRKKGVQSIHTKLLLQVCSKRGNILWVPSYQEDLDNALDKVALLGIDTSTSKGKTIMAACCTINSTFSLLSSATTQVDDNSEKFSKMVQITLKCIEDYKQRNKVPPKELIVFVNAVPADQVKMLQDNYAEVLKDKLPRAYERDVRIVVVMVNLRNTERFFTVGHEARNVPPGTLINSGVVSNDYDFFIVSQDSTRGSVVPNHYKVIFSDNDSKLEEGHLQELIHSQCFNYVNWSGSIKIPAILQYAKKCARFNAEVMGGVEVNKNLQTRPYFI